MSFYVIQQHLYKTVFLPFPEILFLYFQYTSNYSCITWTAVRLVYNPFSQFISLAELYSQLQLSLWSYPIALGVSNST